VAPDKEEEPAMEKILWLILGAVALVAALQAATSRRALRVGRIAVGTLMIGAGALVNAMYLATGADWSTFADAAHFDFVRDTWRSLVAPNDLLFISLLIVFEVTAGVLVLSGGRKAQLGYLALIGMHIGLLPFGWVPYTFWAVPMLVAFALLFRAEHHHSLAAEMVSATLTDTDGSNRDQAQLAGFP
jgi:uncharacterized membrane protein